MFFGTASRALEIAASIQSAAREQGMAMTPSVSDMTRDKVARIGILEDNPLNAAVQLQSVEDVLRFLEFSFPDCAGYSQNRRGSPILDLSDEARLQDLLYIMLKPVLADLVSEQPVAGYTRQYTIQDFRSRRLRLVLEAKRVRDKAHGRTIKMELNDDIGNYKLDPFCDDLIFFVYDPGTFVESPSGLIKSVEGVHTHESRQIRVSCVVQR